MDNKIREFNRGALRMAINLIKHHEGFKKKVYRCSAGKLTIGYGFTKTIISSLSYTNKQLLEDSFSKGYIREEQAETILENICNKLGHEIMDYDAARESPYRFTDNELAALISFAYNVGIQAYFSSSLHKAIIEEPRDYEKIKKCFLMWNKVTVNKAGKEVKEELPGLTKRRIEEFNLFKGATDV